MQINSPPTPCSLASLSVKTPLLVVIIPTPKPFLTEGISFDEKIILEEIIPIVIQINGKKRGLIESKRDTSEEKLMQIISKDEKINKYIVDKIIKKKIFIPNKLINIIM